MAYSKGGKIEAADINTLISNVNSVLTDLGQTPLANVNQYGKITYTEWNAIVTKLSNLANHSGTTITSVAIPQSGTRVDYIAGILTNRDSVITNKRNAAAQSSFVYNSTSVTAGWSDKITFTQSVTFASASAAVNYFNAGGQLALQFVHPQSNTGIDGVFNSLATNCGTLVMSGQGDATTRRIVGTDYRGFEKIGDGGNAPTTWIKTAGFAGLTNTSTSIFYQVGSTYTNPAAGGGTYSANYIQVKAYTSNSGATINFETIWDEVPNGLAASGTSTPITVNGVSITRSTAFLVFRPPAVTNITNTWGSLVFAGSVVGA
jgi:hypothetical protein